MSRAKYFNRRNYYGLKNLVRPPNKTSRGGWQVMMNPKFQKLAQKMVANPELNSEP